MNNKIMYGRRASGGEHGAIMTKKEVVNFMLDASNYVSSRNLSSIRLLDPSGGQGAFVLSSIDRLFESSKKFDFNFPNSLNNIRVVELDCGRAKTLKIHIEKKLNDLGLNSDTIANKMIINDDFLNSSLPQFDIIVGNPPYVRNENIPESKKNIYRNLFKTFRHRSDLYIAFFEKSLSILSTTGRLCFICPDRWLVNKFGENLRNLISENYNVHMIVNLNDTDPFEENVYGYPIIVRIDSDGIAKHTYYFKIKTLHDLKFILPIINNERHLEINNDLFYKTVQQPKKYDGWIFENRPQFDKHGFKKIEEQNFKIGIGVATGADSIFIGTNLEKEIEKELLIPIVVSKDIKNKNIIWSGNYIINPFDKKSGGLIDLDSYPRARNYLYKHELALKRRYITRQNPEWWYRTIDKIYPNLIEKPKLLFPDITINRIIALDEGQYYPHHNIYYIINESLEDLKVLGAFLLSSFSLNQLTNISVKMRGGYIRWQAQNLRKIWLPNIEELPASIKLDLINYFDRKDIRSIDGIVDSYLHRFYLEKKN